MYYFTHPSTSEPIFASLLFYPTGTLGNRFRISVKEKRRTLFLGKSVERQISGYTLACDPGSRAQVDENDPLKLPCSNLVRTVVRTVLAPH